MFDYVIENNETAHITELQLCEVENRFCIVFPEPLRTYLLLHNGDRIKRCEFKIGKEWHDVSLILPILFGKTKFETILGIVRNSDNWPQSLYPFSHDRSGEFYYWDSQTNKVYYEDEDAEGVFALCDSMQEFFDILDQCT
jgi:hypothetical protein